MELYQLDIFGQKKKIKGCAKRGSPRIKNKDLKAKIHTLYSLYFRLYKTQNIPILDTREIIMRKNLIVYPDEMQAEPKETLEMNLLDDIDKRIAITEKEVEKYEQMSL